MLNGINRNVHFNAHFTSSELQAIEAEQMLEELDLEALQ